MILFLSEYPISSNQYRDGFFQRVLDIDSLFLDYDRVYLNIQLFRFTYRNKQVLDNGMVLYNCNALIHFWFILSIFRQSKVVYIQSLYNAIYSIFYIFFFNKKYILDLHGVVPEELFFNEQIFKSKVFNKIEFFLFKKIDLVVAVTNSLANHYKAKYPKSIVEYIIYNILPSHIERFDLPNLLDECTTIEIIYSGNLQKWQNIDMMMMTIKNNLYPNYNYTILTGDIEGMRAKLVQFELLASPNVILKSIAPTELKEYYIKSNYGFILRDDIIVNNVASPTKLTEYMNYGVIPVVLSDDIGDFKELDYDRITLREFDGNLKSKKSSKNIAIINHLRDLNQTSIRRRLLND